MTLKELLAKVDTTKFIPYENSFWDYKSLGLDLGIQGFYGAEEEKLKLFSEYPLHTWQCTDTMVGWNALYLDKELICISYQSARKSDTKYYWVSPELAETTRQYLLQAIPKQEDNLSYLSESKLELDLASDYHPRNPFANIDVD